MKPKPPRRYIKHIARVHRTTPKRVVKAINRHDAWAIDALMRTLRVNSKDELPTD